MTQVLGIIEFYYGGTKIDIKPGASLKLGGVVSKPVIFGTQVGYSGTMAESEVKVKAVVKKGVRITDVFPSNVGQEAQVHCDTGQIFTFFDMFRAGTLDVTSGDNSEVDLTFNAGMVLEN